ncbi:MAG: (di)nucleoside polyphosphate hydrolase [Candidatus Peregrinibacteria bacterium Greene0416_19]|nr:MAG: (di)nucleoside polyphosphate hydrolase [Candidatus Peregrinibacteria bacterium Greene0416_19]
MTRHFTATAFVLDSQQRVLLLWHRRLGRWMPPGGHVDENETPEETAKRECREETGLEVEIIGSSTGLTTGSELDLFAKNPEEGHMLKKPIAFLLENIPASEQRDEPAHQHMDFLYLARPIDEDQILTLDESEGGELRWFTKEQIQALDEGTAIFSNVKAYILSAMT